MPELPLKRVFVKPSAFTPGEALSVTAKALNPQLKSRHTSGVVRDIFRLLQLRA
jgi:hypothetical protein